MVLVGICVVEILSLQAKGSVFPARVGGCWAASPSFFLSLFIEIFLEHSEEEKRTELRSGNDKKNNS